MNSVEATQKIKTERPYDPAITLLGMYSKESKPAYYGDPSTPMSNVVLFTVANSWNYSQCPSTNE
jgi:hypothetical protein